MSFIINHNLMANAVARNLNSAYRSLSQVVNRLSSGLRINSSADDAAGLAVSELMRADIASLNQGMRNTADAVSMVQTADGAMQIIHEKLIRMKELATQASTGTYNSDQRLMLHSEYIAMRSEIERIAEATEFNGIDVLSGEASDAMNAADWELANVRGFGDVNNFEINQLYVFNGKMYAGVEDANSNLAELWSYDGLSWTRVGNDGLGVNMDNITKMMTLDGQLYVMGSTNNPPDRPRILRVDGIDSLTDVTDPTAASAAGEFTGADVYDGKLYVTNGDELTAYDGTSWSTIVSDGLGVGNTLTQVLTVNEYLYVGANNANGCQLWRYDGSSWTQIGTSGLNGDANNDYLTALVVHDGNLCIGTENDTDGGEVWRLDSSGLTQMNQDGFGDANNIEVSSLVSYHGKLYATGITGGVDARVYEYGDGTWTQANEDGFDIGADYISGGVVFQDDLFFGTAAGPPGAAIFSNHTDANIKIHFGTANDSAEDYYYIDFASAKLDSLNVNNTWINTQENAQEVVEVLDGAIIKADQIRAHFGAMQNRLEATQENLAIQAENLQASESRIRDADVAVEMTRYVRLQILTQAATSMLAQANDLARQVLKLLM